MSETDKKSNITEQAYLELAAAAKEKYDELDKRADKYRDNIVVLQKELISCYGYVRIMHSVYVDNQEDPQIEIMMEVLRGFLSQFIQDNFMKDIDNLKL